MPRLIPFALIGGLVLLTIASMGLGITQEAHLTFMSAPMANPPDALHSASLIQSGALGGVVGDGLVLLGLLATYLVYRRQRFDARQHEIVSTSPP